MHWELYHVAEDYSEAVDLAAQHPERFARVIASNTGLPLGEGESDFMKMWVGMMREATVFPWQMLEGGMQRKLTEGEVADTREVVAKRWVSVSEALSLMTHTSERALLPRGAGFTA